MGDERAAGRVQERDVTDLTEAEALALINAPKKRLVSEKQEVRCMVYIHLREASSAFFEAYTLSDYSQTAAEWAEDNAIRQLHLAVKALGGTLTMPLNPRREGEQPQ
jgi:hypothetical protein